MTWTDNFIGTKGPLPQDPSDLFDTLQVNQLAVTISGRTKQTCYWSKRDEGMVWDHETLHTNASHLDVNSAVPEHDAWPPSLPL